MKIKRIVLSVLFLAFCFFVLMGTLRPFVEETALQTPFYTTSAFAHDMMSHVGGMLYLAASFLQSCFSIPWLGTLLLALLLLLLALSICWAFKVDCELEPLCLVPSVALLLNYTQVGYLIYLLKVPAIAFTAPLGLLVSVLLTGLWLRISKWQLRTLLVLLFCTAGYWFLGVYAVFAACLTGFLSIGTFLHNRTHKSELALGLTLLVAIIVVPSVLYDLSCFMMLPRDIYLSGLPDFHWSSSERSYFYPLIVAVALIVVLAFCKMRKLRRWLWWASAAVYALALYVCYQSSYRDANFLTTLQYKHLADEGRFDDIVALSRQIDHEPTRAEVMYTRLALFETGRLGDELFQYSDGDAPYNSPRDFQYLRLLAARQIYYYLGKVNFAYRWAMEDMVEYGHRPEYLIYLAKCALLNKEDKLAYKYLDELKCSPWYRDVANQYMPYVNNPALVKKDRQMAKILPMLQYEDVLDADAGMIEMYVLNSFAYTEGGSRQMVELSLMCNLITKNLNSAWQRFMILLPTWHGHIPRHYQEAALMISQLSGGRINVSSLPIDNEIRQSFNNLVQASAQNGDNNQNAQLLKPEFGGTYWYYYFFVNGLKTN